MYKLTMRCANIFSDVGSINAFAERTMWRAELEACAAAFRMIM